MADGPRIAYVVSGPLTSGQLEAMGGADQPRVELYLASRRPDVVFFSLDHSSERRPRLFRLAAKRALKHLIYARDLSARAKDFDAFVTSGEDIGLPLSWMLNKRGSKAKVVVPVHGFYFESKPFKLQFAACRGLPNVQFACLSAAVRDRLINTFGGDPTRCHDTGYGVDVDFFSPDAASPSSIAEHALPVIASAGASNRDYPTLIAATHDLAVKVKIAAASQWVEHSPDAPVDAKVEMGSVGNYINLRQLYADAALVVVPLTDKTFATGYAVIAEAMAMGRPVIATRTQAPSDFIRDGENGVLVAPEDAAALRTAIVGLLSDEGRRKALGRAARRTMQANSVQIYLDRLLALAGHVEPNITAPPRP